MPQFTRSFEFVVESECLFTSRFVEVAADVQVSGDGSEYVVRILSVDGARLSDLGESHVEQIDDAFCEAMRREENTAAARCFRVRNLNEVKALTTAEPGKYPALERYLAGTLS